jgi:Uma2 family endonuclease
MIKLYTAEEYLELHYGQRSELVRGIIQAREPVSFAHSYTAIEIATAIRNYLESHPIGVAVIEAGYVTERGPDTVRGPDVSFVTWQRAKGVKGDGFADIAPDLAVEVLSPSNRMSDMTKKVLEYFSMGTRLAWLADLKRRTVAVYTPDALPYVVGGSEFLDGGEVLPGFRVAVNKLFGWPPSETPGE